MVMTCDGDAQQAPPPDAWALLGFRVSASALGAPPALQALGAFDEVEHSSWGAGWQRQLCGAWPAGLAPTS